mgnify:CR=1 FL=1
MSDEITTDEYGEINVFSEERLAKLKGKANTEYVIMCEIIKKSEMALTGIVEWLKAAEKNEFRFASASKAYIETLKAVETENNKPKF